MTKKKIQVEVDYPDCDLCGECIGEGEQYIKLDLAGTRFTCHHIVYTTTGIPLKAKTMVICKRCATEYRSENKDKLKQRLQEEVDDMLSGANWVDGKA